MKRDDIIRMAWDTKSTVASSNGCATNFRFTIDELERFVELVAEAERESVNAWLPIESAPKGSGEDGPHDVTDQNYVAPPKLLLITEEGIEVGYYDWYYHEGYGVGARKGVSAWRTTSGEPAYNPTHWQSVPAEPRSTT